MLNINYMTLILIRNEIFEELKNMEFNEFEDMVFRMELTYSEIEKILDMTYILPHHLPDIPYHLEYMKVVI